MEAIQKDKPGSKKRHTIVALWTLCVGAEAKTKGHSATERLYESALKDFQSNQLMSGYIHLFVNGAVYVVCNKDICRLQLMSDLRTHATSLLLHGFDQDTHPLYSDNNKRTRVLLNDVFFTIFSYYSITHSFTN